jgi:hypothetical protein
MLITPNNAVIVSIITTVLYGPRGDKTAWPAEQSKEFPEPQWFRGATDDFRQQRMSGRGQAAREGGNIRAESRYNLDEYVPDGREPSRVGKLFSPIPENRALQQPCRKKPNALLAKPPHGSFGRVPECPPRGDAKPPKTTDRRMGAGSTVRQLRNALGKPVEAGQSFILLFEETAIHHAFCGGWLRFGAWCNDRVIAVQPAFRSIIDI